MQQVKTICQMCSSFCGLTVTVSDGKIAMIEGMKEHYLSEGRLCSKGIASAHLPTDPNRLKYPLKQCGERGSTNWKKISWENALDEIAGKIFDHANEFGKESLGFYRGQGPGWDTNYFYLRRLVNSWGSPNLFTHGQLCFTPRELAHIATYGTFLEPDYENTNCISLIGTNPACTSPINHMARIIRAKERGAKLIVIDPRFSNTAAKADVYLQPRPGTDGALILGMLRIIITEGLFDKDYVSEWIGGFNNIKALVDPYTTEKVEAITWVSAENIRDVSHTISMTKPALIVDGNGIEEHTNVVQTTRAIAILRSLIHSVGEKGGSLLTPPLAALGVGKIFQVESSSDLSPKPKYPIFYSTTKFLTGVELVDSLRNRKDHIKALIVQGGDPIISLSDSNVTQEVLQNIDFIVVHDLYPTAISQIADIILPAASFLERDLVHYYKPFDRPSAHCNLVTMQNLCVPPYGESKSDLDFIFLLAQRLGLKDHFPWEDPIEAFNWQLEPLKIDVSWLQENPAGYVIEYPDEDLYQKYENDGFNTPSGKIEFYSNLFANNGAEPLPKYNEPANGLSYISDLVSEYPFICSTGLKLGIHTHSQFRTVEWIREKAPGPFAEIHPETAAKLSIRDNEIIQISSPNGSVKVKAKIVLTGDPRVIFISHGYGQPYSGINVITNVLTSEHGRDPITGTTENRSFLCKIEKLETQDV